LKHLIISEILLLSEKEKKARRESFDPTRTIVFGSNETGKSSLLKAIYYAFGAEPAKQHPRWRAAEVKTLVKFTVENSAFMLLRDESYFALFSGNGLFLKSFTRLVDDFAPYLAAMFDFGLVLASRQETPQIPPPAFLFLPFYMDQDASWQNPWNGFDKLAQYAGWKSPLVDYHTGIRDNAYYAVSAGAITKQSSLNDIVNQEKGITAVAKKLDSDTSTAIFSLNPQVCDDQIKRLLSESEALLGQENKLKEKLTRLTNERQLQRTRLAIAKQALGELSADFKFLTDAPTEEIECPTCGNHYQNDFAVRFSIASDDDRVAEFIAHINAELDRVDKDLRGVYEEYSVTKSQAERIQMILAEKQEELTLGMVIESEGRRAADRLLTDQLNSCRLQRTEVEQQLEELKKEMKELDLKSSDVRAKAMEEYQRTLRRNFIALGVNTFSQDVFKSLTPSLFETGSTLPRALLAYNFSILDLVTKHSPATVCPIVIDSPNQQAQDPESLTRILEFIHGNQPKGTQLILGLENDLGIAFGGKTIKTEVKHALLKAEHYESAHRELFDLLKQSLKPSE
jgi:hypothetical protein